MLTEFGASLPNTSQPSALSSEHLKSWQVSTFLLLNREIQQASCCALMQESFTARIDLEQTSGFPFVAIIADSLPALVLNPIPKTAYLLLLAYSTQSHSCF